MSRPQATLATPVTFRGVGVHTGAEATCRVLPAPAGSGRTFLVRGEEVPATVDSVARVDRCTLLGRGEATVSTVEHLLAAAAGLRLDNLRIEVKGPEVPILDGSAAGFAREMRAAGRVEQGEPAREIRLLRAVWVAEGEALAVALPAEVPSYECAIDFAHPLVGHQRFCFEPGSGDFLEEVAPARTFGFWDEVQALLERGLARGGSLDNALVIGGPGGFSSPPRFPDEPARHKCLDLIGDLALLGADLKARVLAVRSGHRLHVALAREILKGSPVPCPTGGS